VRRVTCDVCRAKSDLYFIADENRPSGTITPNPKTQTPNPKPQTPKPPNPKPQTPNPKPQTPSIYIRIRRDVESHAAGCDFGGGGCDDDADDGDGDYREIYDAEDDNDDDHPNPKPQTSNPKCVAVHGVQSHLHHTSAPRLTCDETLNPKPQPPNPKPQPPTPNSPQI